MNLIIKTGHAAFSWIWMTRGIQKPSDIILYPTSFFLRSTGNIIPPSPTPSPEWTPMNMDPKDDNYASQPTWKVAKGCEKSKGDTDVCWGCSKAAGDVFQIYPHGFDRTNLRACHQKYGENHREAPWNGYLRTAPSPFHDVASPASQYYISY